MNEIETHKIKVNTIVDMLIDISDEVKEYIKEELIELIASINTKEVTDKEVLMTLKIKLCELLD